MGHVATDFNRALWLWSWAVRHRQRRNARLGVSVPARRWQLGQRA